MQTPRSSNAILVIILISYLMIILDISIVFTALPTIHNTLQFTDSSLTWVSNAYTLTFGGFLLLAARLGDVFGRRFMLLLGLSLFTASSLWIAMAQSPIVLILGRVVQGLGSSILAPTTIALLSTTFQEGKQRTQAVAYYGAVAGVGSSVGLVIGGILTTMFSWRIGFLINLPLGLFLLWMSQKYITESQKQNISIDWIGAVLSSVGMISLVYSLVRSTTHGWENLITRLTFLWSLLLLCIFTILQKKVRTPILPFEIFKNAERLGAYLARFFFLGAMMGLWFFMTLFLQQVYGYSAVQAGLAFLPMTIIHFMTALLIPKLTKHIPNSVIVVLGIFLTFIGMFWLSQLTVSTPWLTGIALPMMVIGIGQGASLGPLTISGMRQIQSEYAGAASGAMNVAHQIGGAVGLSVILVIFARAGQHLPVNIETIAHQTSAAFNASAVMLFFAFVLALVLIAPSDRHLLLRK